ncbi:hypothetical protein G7085_11215 [Tessaracoccus sp. HDW20]|uniref:hypothetical protein n=1 Tax=Tessaracoccus coleopterorum TaxID=2714950 RepID=UPI0018D34D2C|nr:hypothetical protein [Tessaracoccus coleopterorum]NHB84990.1 hypothetical protein [Tessaracoccus coleopterorum]
MLGVVSAVALGSFLPMALATFIVQPCRGCEPRDLSEQGQGVVAFLAVSGGLVWWYRRDQVA